MTATVTIDQARAFVENIIGRPLDDDEAARAARYANADSLFALTPDEVREARAFGILA